MAEPRTIRSPNESVAKKEVLTVQEAQTMIKQIIVEGIYQGIDNTEMAKRINAVINEVSAGLKPELAMTVRLALAQSAQNWHFQYMTNLRAVNMSAIEAMMKTKEVRVANKTYNIDIKSLAGAKPAEQSTIIEKFRPYITESKHGIALIDDYEKRVKAQIRVLASNPANTYPTDKNGDTYRMNMRNFAEMKVRYDANQEDVAKFKNEGVDLVWTSSHADASGRCAPYQGRLYSISGKTGRTAAGEPYTPLDEALLGPKGDGNGIINGYNCRHHLIEYTPKSKAPKEYDAATIRKENVVNGRQRQYERDIRNLKIEERLERAVGDKSAASDLRNQWQSLNQRYEQYSLQNGRAFYPWRTRVMQEEVEQD